MKVVTARPGYELWRPNRERADSRITKALVALVLLVSAGLIATITFGGWSRLQGGAVTTVALAWTGLYVLFAILVARWRRGVLPVAAALAVILAILAAIAAPAWFDRARDGLSSPALPEELLGLLTVVLAGVQAALVVVAFVGFRQEWHVEEERPVAAAGPGAGAGAEAGEPGTAQPQAG